MTTDAQPNENGRGKDRRFSVSSNRGAARHRLRYVEAGGASVDTEECSFCQSNPELDWHAETTSPPAQRSPENAGNPGERPKED